MISDLNWCMKQRRRKRIQQPFFSKAPGSIFHAILAANSCSTRSVVPNCSIYKIGQLNLILVRVCVCVCACACSVFKLIHKNALRPRRLVDCCCARARNSLEGAGTIVNVHTDKKWAFSNSYWPPPFLLKPDPPSPSISPFTPTPFTHII